MQNTHTLKKFKTTKKPYTHPKQKKKIIKKNKKNQQKHQ